MTPEKEQELLKRIEELERKSIRVNLDPTETENIKNAVFENYVTGLGSTAASGTIKYLKVIWKNKIIYIQAYD
jgi:hypothetical protein